MTTYGTHRTIEEIWTIKSARIIAGVARIVQDLSIAEDLAQDALVIALEKWPESGIPEKPGAWLMTVANVGRLIFCVEINYVIKNMRNRSQHGIQNENVVPISKDLYEVILAQKKLMQEKFPGEKNPDNLLILSQSKKSIGRPFLQLTVLRAFHRFAEKVRYPR